MQRTCSHDFNGSLDQIALRISLILWQKCVAPEQILGLFVILLLILFWPQTKGLWWLHYHPDPRAHIYRAVGLWLADNSPPDANIGALEVGIIGYYARRQMIDFSGLIQPDVAQRLSCEATYQDAAIWAVETYHPDYLAINPEGVPLLMERCVAHACKELQSFAGDAYGYDGDMVVYVCSWTQ